MNMIASYTYRVGAAHRRKILIHLDQLGLPYVEHRGLLDSIIVVKTYTEFHEDAHSEFRNDFREFQNRLREAGRWKEEHKAREKREEVAREEAKLLARKNRFRRLTFRKPLEKLLS